jgi:hypothetical protein
MSKVKPLGSVKRDQSLLRRITLYKYKMMTNAYRRDQAGVRNTSVLPLENGAHTRNGVKT